MAKSTKTTESAGSKSPAKTQAKAASPDSGSGSKASSGTGTAGTRAGGGLAQPVQPSEQLAAVVGKEPLPRAMIVKKMWDYIKSHDLQNPKNKREILADDTLEAIFGKAKVTMFEMNSLIARHVT